MLRKTGIGIAVVLGLVLTIAAVTATSNAHFVGTPQLTISGNTVTASGKVAGLGQVNEILVTVSGDAACINPGSKKPQAANKESFSAEGNFPVQNGKALFDVTLTATFQPDCTPPMSLQWSNLVITVTAVPDDGTFLQFPQ
jgi:hypothetical protein